MKKIKISERIARQLSSVYYLKQLNSVERKEVRKNLEKLDHGHAYFGAILFSIIQIIFIIYDSITGFYETNKAQFGYLNLATEIVIIVFALITIHMMDISKNDKVKTIMGSLFYFILIGGMCIYIFFDLYRKTDIYPIALFYIIGLVARPNSNFYRNIAHFLTILFGVSGVYLYIMITKNTSSTFIYSLVVIIFSFIGSCSIQTSYVKNEILLYKNEQLHKELEKQSMFDQLTHALNRYSLKKEYDRLMSIKDITPTVGIIMFDIDYFKSYNDHYSHVEGDKILTKIVETVRMCCDKVTPHIYRYGGEEFIIITYDVSEERLVKKANDVRKCVYDAKIKRDDIKEFDRITISVGCDVVDLTKIENINDIYNIVDEQLYNAKRKNKNCVSFKGKISREVE